MNNKDRQLVSRYRKLFKEIAEARGEAVARRYITAKINKIVKERGD